MKILIIIAAILTAVAVGMWLLVRKFSGLLNPPLRVHVVPENSGNGCMRREMQKYGQDLDAQGFEEIGTFRIPEIAGLVLTAYTQPYQSVSAVVYNHPLAGCFVDVFSENERGQSLTVSSAPAGEELDHPPGHNKVIDKTMMVVEMYDFLLTRRPSGPHKRIDETNFVEEFQAAYAKDMDWRMSRGGVTDEEVRRSAEAIGVTSERAIQRTAKKLQEQYAEKQRVLPCEMDELGHCPYEYENSPDRDIEGMPFADGDPRSCPKYGHVCPTFMEDFGLTTEDLNIRASIHCGEVIDNLVKQGMVEKDSPEYLKQKTKSENMQRLYPREKFPQYY